MTTQIQFPNLARSPIQMCQLQAHHLAHHFLRQLLRTAPRPARLFFHPANPIAQKTLLPLVSGLRADPILLAQRPKVQRAHRSQGKLNSLFHRFCSSPRHRAPSSSALCQNSVTYVLNLLCYLCPEPAPCHDRAVTRAIRAETIEADVLRRGSRKECERLRSRHDRTPDNSESRSLETSAILVV